MNSVSIITKELIQEFSDVVGDSISCLPGEYEIKVDDSVEHVNHAPFEYNRRHSHKNAWKPGIFYFRRKHGLLPD